MFDTTLLNDGWHDLKAELLFDNGDSQFVQSRFQVVNNRFIGEKVTFYHYDLLGSPIATTDELGNKVWREEYTPYGEKLLNQDKATDNDNVRGYTGHVFDEETGLTYMQARYYDPRVGRFMGVDPVGFMSSNPISFNRFAYANNNPFRFTDPFGMSAEDKSGELDNSGDNDPSEPSLEDSMGVSDKSLEEFAKKGYPNVEKANNVVQESAFDALMALLGWKVSTKAIKATKAEMAPPSAKNNPKTAKNSHTMTVKGLDEMKKERESRKTGTIDTKARDAAFATNISKMSKGRLQEQPPSTLLGKAMQIVSDAINAWNGSGGNGL